MDQTIPPTTPTVPIAAEPNATGPQALLIPYAASLMSYGVTIYRDEQMTRISLPPPPLWKRVDFVLLVLFSAYLVVAGLVPAVAGMVSKTPPGQSRWVNAVGMLIGLAPYLLMFAGLFVVFRWYLKMKPVVIESDAKGLRILDLKPPTGKNGPSEVWMKRASIYRIAYVAHAKAVMIRCYDHELVEIPIRYRPMACEELAQLLRETVGIPNPDARPLGKAE